MINKLECLTNGVNYILPEQQDDKQWEINNSLTLLQ